MASTQGEEDMKFSTMVLMSVAVAAISGGALATGINKGPTFKFAATDIIATVDCTSKGGAVSTGSDGSIKICALPLGSNSLKFANADTLAATDCTTTGGVVSTNSDGSKTCTKGATLPAPPAPTREPSN